MRKKNARLYGRAFFCASCMHHNDTTTTELLDVFQFDEEVQRRVRRDGGSGTLGSVAELGGDFEFDHAALADLLHAFSPAGDHPVEGEGDRLAAVVGAVEDFFAVEPAVVVDFDRLRGLRLGVSPGP